MKNPLITVIEAIMGKKHTVSEEEIKNAEITGEIVANNAAKRLGIVEQVNVDAQKAREAVKAVEEKNKKPQNNERE